jgi:hypothetical protein
MRQHCLLGDQPCCRCYGSRLCAFSPQTLESLLLPFARQRRGMCLAAAVGKDGEQRPHHVRGTDLTPGPRPRRPAGAPRRLCGRTRRGRCLTAPGHGLGWGTASRPGLAYALLCCILDLPPFLTTRVPLGERRTPRIGLHPPAPLEVRRRRSRPGDEPERLAIDPRRPGAGRTGGTPARLPCASRAHRPSTLSRKGVR